MKKNGEKEKIIRILEGVIKGKKKQNEAKSKIM